MADIERSFLEGKERDEIVAIAGALGLKANGRAKKDTLIDQIMEVTGVSKPAAAPRKPAARKPKTPAQPTLDIPSDSSPAPSAPALGDSPKLESANGTGRSGGSDNSGRSGGSVRSSGDEAQSSSAPAADGAGPVGAGPTPGGPRNDRNRGGKPNQNRRPAPQASFDPFADAEPIVPGTTSSAIEDEWAFAAAKPAQSDRRRQRPAATNAAHVTTATEARATTGVTVTGPTAQTATEVHAMTGTETTGTETTGIAAAGIDSIEDPVQIAVQNAQRATRHKARANGVHRAASHRATTMASRPLPPRLSCKMVLRATATKAAGEADGNDSAIVSVSAKAEDQGHKAPTKAAAARVVPTNPTTLATTLAAIPVVGSLASATTTPLVAVPADEAKPLVTAK